MTTEQIQTPALAVLPSLSSFTEKDVAISFEFFPPKSDKMEEQLWQAVHRLSPLHPSFMSVTYGAGGSTRTRTHATVTKLQGETGISCAAHLTCVGSNVQEIELIANHYWESGIRHIVALRGDVPQDMSAKPVPDGLNYASDLVRALKKVADFDVSVACYPEKHPEASSLEVDIDHLERKIDAGANRAITQFFFDVEAFERFMELLAKRRINIPVIPGILPVSNVERTRQFAQQCGAHIPDWMQKRFDGLDNDPETRQLVAMVVAVEQCRALHRLGVRQFHFYTLNRAELVYSICRMLGINSEAAHKVQARP
ncbi:MAG: methylenetetrahydrofolate reductase [NAD(P)H] [Alphaproteobacteria bacterium]